MWHPFCPTGCCALQYKSHGCYADNIGDRNLPILAFSDRDIDWNNWEIFMYNFICRCAYAARNNGSQFFGVQFYGKHELLHVGAHWRHIVNQDTMRARISFSFWLEKAKLNGKNDNVFLEWKSCRKTLKNSKIKEKFTSLSFGCIEKHVTLRRI